MRPKEITAFLESIVRCVNPPTVFIWGPPGVGKSNVVRQVAEEEQIGFVDLRLALMDPTDLRGIPVPEDGKAKWLPPSALPTGGRGIVFLDELNLAPLLVQSSAYQLVLPPHKIGEYQLPKGWCVIAAGNKTEHGANIYKMAAPLRNRFVHVDFEVDINDWREWAIKNDVVSEVVEFVSFRPDFLFQFDPKRHENAFPTPRSWEIVSTILKNQNGLSKEIVDKVVEGTIGAGAATELRGYLRMREDLPAVDDILNGKDFIPPQIDIACALVSALVIRARPGQYARLLHYSDKLSADVAVLLGKLLVQKDKQGVLECSAWPAWSKKHYALVS